MTDALPPGGPAPPVPELPLAPPPRRLLDRLSAVWLLPLAALAVVGVVALQTWREQGPVIEIAFADASGIAARETQLRFRDVPVGLVESVRFGPGLDRVLVAVRLTPEVAPYVDAGAKFWVVRPRVTTSGITGIETVLTGVHIEGVWDNVPGEPQESYLGLETAPLLGAGEEGLSIGLRSTDGALTATMPIFYKGVQVGEVGEPRVAADGLSVEAEAVIYAPYDRLVTEATRFWDTSGFTLNFTLGAGAGIDFDNLTSLIIGGIAFDTFASGARPAEAGDVFDVFLDEAAARDAVFAEPGAPALELVTIFEGNAAGLAVGAPVELDGLRVGEVRAVNGLLDPARFGDTRARLQALISIQPARLGLGAEDGPPEVLAWLQARVAEDGLRARLATGNILTGGLEVQLVELPDAPPAAIDLANLPAPLLPSAPSDIADVGATLEGTLGRLDDLPIEELLASAIGFLDNASVLVGSQEAQAIPAEVLGAIDDIRAVTASPEIQALPAELAAALAEIEGAAAELRGLLAAAEEAATVARLSAALDSAGRAADALALAGQGVPDLVARLSAVAARAEALPAEELVAELAGLATDARALLGSDGVQALPGRLDALGAEAQGVLAEARAALAALDTAALGARLDATLAAAEHAAAGVAASVEGVPALVARLDALAAQLAGLPLDPLAAELAATAAAARALLEEPATRELPQRLGTLSAQATSTLAELRRGIEALDAAALGARLDSTLASAAAAAGSVQAAAAGLPALTARLDALAARAETLPLEDLVAEIAAAAAAAEALLAAPATQALPADLSAALGEARALLAEARAGGLVANANAMLAAAAEAAQALPPLAQGAQALLDQASAALRAMGNSRGVVAEAEAAMREVAQAAEAVAALARSLERRPNALIFGRD